VREWWVGERRIDRKRRWLRLDDGLFRTAAKSWNNVRDAYCGRARLVAVLFCAFVIYRAMLCIRAFGGTSHGPVSVSVRLCLSVTSRCSTKTAQHRITQITPHDSPRTLIFSRQRSLRNSTEVTPYGGAKCRWVGQNRRLSTNNRLYLENGTR